MRRVQVYWEEELREIEVPDDATVTRLASGQYLVQIGEHVQEVFVQDGRLSDGNELDQIAVRVETERARILRERFANVGAGVAAASGLRTVKAPMPGLIRVVNTSVGDTVERTTTLLVLEAMKMENNIAAGVDGRITKVHVEQGQSVDKNAALVEIACD